MARASTCDRLVVPVQSVDERQLPRRQSLVCVLPRWAPGAGGMGSSPVKSVAPPATTRAAADVSALAICRVSGDGVRLWTCSPFLHSSGRSARVMNQKAARLDRSATTAGSTLWREVTVLWLARTLLA